MMHSTLQVIFNEMREVIVSPSYRAMIMQHFAGPGHAKESISGSQEVETSIRELAQRVLDLLDQPLRF